MADTVIPLHGQCNGCDEPALDVCSDCGLSLCLDHVDAEDRYQRLLKQIGITGPGHFCGHPELVARLKNITPQSNQ